MKDNLELRGNRNYNQEFTKYNFPFIHLYIIHFFFDLEKKTDDIDRMLSNFIRTKETL